MLKQQIFRNTEITLQLYIVTQLTALHSFFRLKLIFTLRSLNCYR